MLEEEIQHPSSGQIRDENEVDTTQVLCPDSHPKHFHSERPATQPERICPISIGTVSPYPWQTLGILWDKEKHHQFQKICKDP